MPTLHINTETHQETLMKKLLITAAALALTACSTVPNAPKTAQVSLNFAAQINGQSFVCGQRYDGVGTTRSSIMPSDFRMYVSEVKLLRQDGSAVPVQLAQDGIWQHQNVALIDFENGTGPCRNGTTATNTAVRGQVPAGDYVGVELTVGVQLHGHVLELARRLQVHQVRHHQQWHQHRQTGCSQRHGSCHALFGAPGQHRVRGRQQNPSPQRLPKPQPNDRAPEPV
jgi:hypothetical protein